MPQNLLRVFPTTGPVGATSLEVLARNQVEYHLPLIQRLVVIADFDENIGKHSASRPHDLDSDGPNGAAGRISSGKRLP